MAIKNHIASKTIWRLKLTKADLTFILRIPADLLPVLPPPPSIHDLGAILNCHYNRILQKTFIKEEKIVIFQCFDLKLLLIFSITKFSPAAPIHSSTFSSAERVNGKLFLM